MSPGGLPGEAAPVELAETHISWVLIGRDYVYKLKKPRRYSFLDFSTAAMRRYYCEREVELNRRLTQDIYLGVVPVRHLNGRWTLGEGEGEIVDHAVWMRKMDPRRQMDLLVQEGKLGREDILALAEVISRFHRQGLIVHQTARLSQRQLFNDLEKQAAFLENQAGVEAGDIIRRAVSHSDEFLARNELLLQARREAGFFRDGHGDLHCRNIFLLAAPQVFDCIEFNDDLRRIDVLNDIAFLCMDLDSRGRHDLSALFYEEYIRRFPCSPGAGGLLLFHYYKAYRANIRAKVNSLRARGAETETERDRAIQEAVRYLRLMDSYWPANERT